MTTLTVKDIERARPPHGTLVVLGGGVEVVYGRRLGRVCGDCIFSSDEADEKALGTTCRKVMCGSGEYIPKMKYLELKLMGEIT